MSKRQLYLKIVELIKENKLMLAGAIIRQCERLQSFRDAQDNLQTVLYGLQQEAVRIVEFDDGANVVAINVIGASRQLFVSHQVDRNRLVYKLMTK